MTAFDSPRDIMCALAQHVKSAVHPHMGTWRARRVTGIASSGDATFDIDEIAEGAVESFLIDNEVNVAYYSEDRGLIHPFPGRDPEGVLIIDPIDGTRGAIAGFEACVVSIAWAKPVAEPTIADVLYGVIVELKGAITLFAERGCGASILDDAGKSIPLALSPTDSIPAMAWATEVVGAPLEHLFQVLAPIANQTTVRGGFFILNSSAFELTRLVTGQLAAVVDLRNRLLHEFPELRDSFVVHGGGRLLSLYGYDVAAATLIVEEAGGIVTDAWGRSLADWKLLDTTEANFGSLIVSSNTELHSKLLRSVDESFANLKQSGL